MTIRLYLDEDSLDTDLVEALRARGVDVQTALEIGMINREDESQLEYAARQSRVLFSFNRRDFQRIHSEWLAEGRSHAGIVLALQQRHSVGEQMRRLLRIMAVLSAEEMKDRLEFLTAWH